MIDVHSKYDNMHENGMLYALICINNHLIIIINLMLLVVHKFEDIFDLNNFWDDGINSTDL